MGMKLNTNILESILESLDEYIVIIDKDLNIVMFTELFKDFFGEKNILIGQKIDNIIYNNNFKKVMASKDRKEQLLDETKEKNAIFIQSPIIENNIVLGAVGKIVFEEDIGKREDEIVNNSLENTAKYNFNNLIGKSDKFITCINLAKKVSKGDSNILITGESGTGKELVAHSIHNASKRKNKPFVKINCAAIPSELFESEMFGYEEGAFTGAKRKGKKGLFEIADGGTMLLDEIGDMDLNMQVKLLRVLQEKEVSRVGGGEVKKIDVRVIAATNKSLLKLIDEGKFREDLYYRLNVIHINLPSLKDRKEDIEPLCDMLIKNICEKYGVYCKGTSKEAMKCLEEYNWPGNVRQLENIIERAINLIDEDVLIKTKHLPEQIIEYKNVKTVFLEQGTLKDSVEKLEKTLIIQTLKDVRGNKNKAANILGLSRAGLYKKIERYSIKTN
ncbi:sigma-54 interaction domain-containing protein [Clostridium ihumii]|uniref:sigma-54 interaction domain-containing protein n=1 Tax=Clostridium ihumii TaxID=1470356 RepID=UPI000A8A8A24|nr:sigma 54-interacting transcriptional regulator [Clostridium ihumii]